jgi:hypothetical protein
VVGAGDLVARFASEYAQARQRLLG